MPQHAKDAGVRVVEVDVDTTAYDQGHVPGAAGWNWTTELCDTLVRDIVPKAKLEELLGKTGIDNKTTIVLYGDNNNWFAAWAFWQLKIYGHDDVRIMDGGRKKWLAEGRELSTDKPSFPATTYKAKRAGPVAPRVPARGAEGGAGRRARRSSTCAARRSSPARFSRRPGLPETCQRGGHIPGAKSIPWAKACNDDGTFKSRRGSEGALRRRGRDRRQAGDRVLPHRRALEPHLVRAEVPARLPEREELRRLVDRVGQSRRRAGREAVTDRNWTESDKSDDCRLEISGLT